MGKLRYSEVACMKREDILLALKEAEDNVRNQVENARKSSERSLAKAKQDSALKMDQGKARAAELRENLLAAKLADMEQEAHIILERGRQRAVKLKNISDSNMNRAIDRLVEAFERDLDV